METADADLGKMEAELRQWGTRLDNRSFRLNFEVVAAFYGGPCVAELAQAFEVDLTHAKPQLRREARSPFAQRLLGSAARLLAPQL